MKIIIWRLRTARNICENIFDEYTFNFDNVTATVDKIFLLSEYEVFGKNSYANSSEQNFQAQYEFFKNGNSKIFYSDEQDVHWWLCSAQFSNDYVKKKISTGVWIKFLRLTLKALKNG